jgi:hypothetical protein
MSDYAAEPPPGDLKCGCFVRVKQEVSGGITSISLPGRATLNRVNIIDVALDRITTGVLDSVNNPCHDSELGILIVQPLLFAPPQSLTTNGRGGKQALRPLSNIYPFSSRGGA